MAPHGPDLLRSDHHATSPHIWSVTLSARRPVPPAAPTMWRVARHDQPHMVACHFTRRVTWRVTWRVTRRATRRATRRITRRVTPQLYLLRRRAHLHRGSIRGSQAVARQDPARPPQDLVCGPVLLAAGRPSLLVRPTRFEHACTQLAPGRLHEASQRPPIRVLRTYCGLQASTAVPQSSHADCKPLLLVRNSIPQHMARPAVVSGLVLPFFGASWIPLSYNVASFFWTIFLSVQAARRV